MHRQEHDKAIHRLEALALANKQVGGLGVGSGGFAISTKRWPSPTLSPTDPVPRGLLTLCPGASSGPQGQWARGTGSVGDSSGPQSQ